MIFGTQAVLKLLKFWRQFFETLRLVGTRGAPSAGSTGSLQASFPRSDSGQAGEDPSASSGQDPRRGAESGTPAEAPPEPALQRESVNPTAPASTPAAAPTVPTAAPVEWRSKNPPVERSKTRKWQRKRKPEQRTTPPRKQGRHTPPLHLSFRKLLPIDTLIPVGIDVECTQALLLWGFMRPAQEKKLINGNYGDLESIIDAVVGKGYPQDGVRKAIHWFTKMGIIICPHPIKGKKILSLSTRASTAPSPNAKKIITIAAHALYQLECLNHGKNPATTA